MSKTTFTIFEKSYLIRKGLTTVIDKIPDTQLVQQIETDEELKSATNLDSDFIIINESFIHPGNLEIIKKLDKNHHLIAIISDKATKPEKKIKWIEHIRLDDSQKVILKKLNTVIGTISKKDTSKDIPDEISKREADILKNIALGYSNKEIGDKLFISTHTVVTHRKNITRKLGIKTVPGLTIYAILNKLIDINDTELLIS